MTKYLGGADERSNPMANKFGKFLFFTAVIGTAAAAGYYIRKRETEASFGKDADSDSSADCKAKGASKSLRNYVSLNPSAAQMENLSEKFSEVSEKVSAVAANVKDTFTPLAQKAASAVQSMQNKIGETMEEFFDEGTLPNDGTFSDEKKPSAEEDSPQEQPASAEAPVEATTESLFDDSDSP